MTVTVISACTQTHVLSCFVCVPRRNTPCVRLFGSGVQDLDFVKLFFSISLARLYYFLLCQLSSVCIKERKNKNETNEKTSEYLFWASCWFSKKQEKPTSFRALALVWARVSLKRIHAFTKMYVACVGLVRLNHTASNANWWNCIVHEVQTAENRHHHFVSFYFFSILLLELHPLSVLLYSLIRILSHSVSQSSCHELNKRNEQ